MMGWKNLAVCRTEEKRNKARQPTGIRVRQVGPSLGHLQPSRFEHTHELLRLFRDTPSHREHAVTIVKVTTTFRPTLTALPIRSRRTPRRQCLGQCRGCRAEPSCECTSTYCATYVCRLSAFALTNAGSLITYFLGLGKGKVSPTYLLRYRPANPSTHFDHQCRSLST